MFLMWEAVSGIHQDSRVNKKYGDGQWAIQDCWAIYFQIWYEKFGDNYGVIS